MKQSNTKKGRDKTAFLYERLSRDDNLEGDSYSIQNQKKLLTKVAKEKGYTNLIHFYDDGISGVTMNRPGFNEMLAELEKGYASAVFVKDAHVKNKTKNSSCSCLSIATTEIYTHVDDSQLQAAVNANPLAMMFS